MTDNTYFSEEDLEKQEHLTAKRFKQFDSATNIKVTQPRPKESLAEIMQWVKGLFGTYAFGEGEKTVFIHNKIVIDGNFCQFCEENGVKIECLYKDSIASWSSEHNFEHFMVMGVFRISKGNFSFVHSALFHKGNQNEDEVSFFNVVSSSQFEKYVELRNQFEEWGRKRDCSSLEIEVVGGNSIPYTRELTWDDLFMKEEQKQQIITSVEGFLGSKEIFQKKKVPWRRGMIFLGQRGCGKSLTLKVIMSQYDQLKPVTIQAGHGSPDELLEEAFSYAEEHSPSLLFFEDLQELISEISVSHFLQLLDGVQTKNGILIVATGNNLKSLEDNIISRPRRFDKKIEFPLPDKELSVAYLKKWFADILDDKEYKNIVKQTVSKKFTYAHLQEIYFTAIFNAVKNSREEPSIKDIETALKEVVMEKGIADKGCSDDYSRRDLTSYTEEEDDE